MPTIAAPPLPGILSPWLLLVAGAAVGWMRNFWNWAYSHTIGQVTQRIQVSVSIEELEHPEAFLWLQHWTEQRLRSRRIAALSLRKCARRRSDAEPASDDGGEANYELFPAEGVYPFLWSGKAVIVNSGKAETPPTDSGLSSSRGLFVRRSMTLSVFPTRDRNMLLRLIEEARSSWEESHPSDQQYYFHRWSYWSSRPLTRRHPSTVYLPPGVFEAILDDARHFLESRAAFEELGTPYRVGYLFFGPPGCGKTTTVIALATALARPLYYLSLASVRSRDDLASLLDAVRPGSIVLIEDIDCVSAAVERMNHRDEAPEGPEVVGQGSQNQAQDRLTTSDLLNQIDGVVASEGRILIMTTNHPENLDAALVRPGRVDRQWEISYPEKEQLLRLHARAVRLSLTRLTSEEFLARLEPQATIASAQTVIFQSAREARP